MSATQEQINRLKNNVQTTLQTIAETGVSVGSNSEALPAAAAALANEKANVNHTHNEYLPKAGGTMTGEIAIGQGDGYGIQLGKDGRINATTSEGSTTATICGISGTDALLGHSSFFTMLRGKASRPTYNGNNIALQSDLANYATKDEVLNAGVATRPKKVSITLSSSAWTEGDEGYTQTVSVTGGTANSLVALQPTIAQMLALQTDGVAALVVDNDNGVFVAKSLAAAPSADITMQATLTEVS